MIGVTAEVDHQPLRGKTDFTHGAHPMTRDHLEFLCDVGELSSLLTGSSGIDSFLQRLVGLVARHLTAHVCSIYVYAESTQELVLRATVGLDTGSTDGVRLSLGEGLVGAVLERSCPILDNHASSNPQYRFFPGIGEEQYDSFLAVPLLKGTEKIGVLAVQREERNHFRDDDMTALRVVACQLVNCIENAQALLELSSAEHGECVPLPLQTSLIRGKVVSPGNGVGPARVLRTSRSLPKLLGELNPNLTLEQFRRGVETTATQIEDLQLRVAEQLPEAVSLIFSAHLLILMDHGFVETMARQIEGGKSVGQAVQDVAQTYIDAFASSKPLHIREKAQDVEDLTVRLAANLADRSTLDSDVERHEIVIARNVYPSELVMLSLEEPAAIVLVGGGATTHVSILARSLQLPLFIADAPNLLEISDGTRILLDGHTGNIYVAPRDEVVSQFAAQEQAIIAAGDSSPRPRAVTMTKDGTRVRLLANINLLREVPIACDMNAEGIGLYRTEFPFVIRTSFPEEEEQYLVYRQLVQSMDGRPVTFRTLDVGGDKTPSYCDHGAGQNPELGIRGIRFSLRHQDIFEQQIRAILRAGADSPELRIMFPMIASLDEFRQARAIVEECVFDLQQRAIPSHKCPHIGMMVELPSVLETAEEFAREADFFSIGSNDFTQYMLAADRGNEDVSSYYCAHHPAVLRAIARFVRTAHRHARAVSICGEMAQQTCYIPFLLGVGLRDFSVAPHCMAELQEFIQSVTLDRAHREAEALLGESTIAGIQSRLRRAGQFGNASMMPSEHAGNELACEHS